MADRDHAHGTAAHVVGNASLKLFGQQDQASRESVFLPDAGVSVEEGSMIGEQFAKPRRQIA